MNWPKQDTPWGCYPTAVSILTGIPVEELVESMGHDGSKVVDESQPDPWGREAFTHSDLVLALLDHGWAMTHIYAAMDRSNYPSFEEIKSRIAKIGCPTVVSVQKSNGWHALAWDVAADRIIDPLIGAELNENPYPVVSLETLHRIREVGINDGYAPVTLPHYRRAPIEKVM